jgi:hypothetical protein
LRSLALKRVAQLLAAVVLALGSLFSPGPASLDSAAYADSGIVPSLDPPRLNSSAVAFGNQVVVAGGLTWNGGAYDPVGNVDVYDMSEGRWSSRRPLPIRGRVTLVVDGGRLFAVGDAGSVPQSAVLTYNPVSDTWTALRQRQIHNGGQGVVATGGRIYVAGGYFENRVEAYDIASDTWSFVAPMRAPRQFMSMVATPSGRILVYGGSSGTSALVSVEEFDPSTNTWSDRSDLPDNVGGLAALGPDGHIYLVGAARLHAHHLATDEYEALPPPSTFRWDFSVVTGPNGKLYVMGGRTWWDQPTGAIEVYDTVTRQWIGDSAPPTISQVRINGGQSATRTADVQLQLVASDGTGSGVHEMSLTNDSGAWTAWQPFTSSLPWQIRPVDGHRSVSVRVRDRVGNLSTVQSATITMDRIAPRGSVAIAGGSASGDRRSIDAPTAGLTLDATDDRSGVAEMRFSNRSDFAGAIWQPYSQTANWNFNGGQTVYAQFRDRAGNTSGISSAALSANPGPESPGPAVDCDPRPRVPVSITRQGGALDVTVSATGPHNTLRAVRFDQFSNATVDAGDQRGMNQPFAISIPASQQPVSQSFTVRRTAAGQAATVRLVVVDGCGEWATLVGGGASAFP